MTATRIVRSDSYWIVVGALVLGDQITKYLVGAMHRTVDIGPISIGKAINQNGVFGLGLANDVLIFIGAALSLLLLFGLLSGRGNPPARLGLWLLLGGAVGNLIDRVFAGGAVDIIGLGNLTRFNLADVMIVLGALSILRSLWWKDE